MFSYFEENISNIKAVCIFILEYRIILMVINDFNQDYIYHLCIDFSCHVNAYIFLVTRPARLAEYLEYRICNPVVAGSILKCVESYA